VQVYLAKLTTTEMAAYAVSRCMIGYVLTIPLGLGIHGVWITLLIEWLLRAAALHARFRGNKWLHLA